MTTEKRVAHCEARQHSDQMFCGACGLAWDVNDLAPPQCPATGQQGRASGGPPRNRRHGDPKPVALLHAAVPVPLSTTPSQAHQRLAEVRGLLATTKVKAPDAPTTWGKPDDEKR